MAALFYVLLCVHLCAYVCCLCVCGLCLKNKNYGNYTKLGGVVIVGNFLKTLLHTHKYTYNIHTLLYIHMCNYSFIVYNIFALNKEF